LTLKNDRNFTNHITQKNNRTLISQEIDPSFLFRPNLKDENDNMFVELAIASQSKYLITSNTKSFVSGKLLFDSINYPWRFLEKMEKNL